LGQWETVILILRGFCLLRRRLFPRIAVARAKCASKKFGNRRISEKKWRAGENKTANTYVIEISL
jgi:hypothetical protein